MGSMKKTLMYFAKICDEKNELPAFDMQELKVFFYKVEKDYPRIFENLKEGAREEELDTFTMSGIIQSINPQYHPHFISPGMSRIWEKKGIYKEIDKDIIEIAQRFYNEAGCNLEGIVGKRTKIFND